MQFTLVSPIQEMEVWNASSDAASFVISHVRQNGSGFHGQAGYAVSWRPIGENRSAASVSGSPFETLGEAKEACNAIAAILTNAGPAGVWLDFDARAVLRKWPSLGNERRAVSTGPYLLIESTLDECLREFMAKPTSVRHLYEIHATPRPSLASATLPKEVILELARLRGIDG
jgi:hypothetical protein